VTLVVWAAWASSVRLMWSPVSLSFGDLPALLPDEWRGLVLGC